MNYEQLILSNLDSPRELESLYRKDPSRFAQAFDALYARSEPSPVMEVWFHRLHFNPEKGSPAPPRRWQELALVVLLSLAAGTATRILLEIIGDWDKVPSINPINLLFPVSVALMVYFLLENRPNMRLVFSIALAFAIAVIYVNIIYVVHRLNVEQSSSIMLSIFHLPLFLWVLLGLAYTGQNPMDRYRRVEYLRYSGEMLINTSIILLGGIVLTMLTFQLFQAIEVDISEFYMKNIAVFGAVASPIVGTYLTRILSKISRNLAPILANVFSPLVLATLTAYLVTLIVMRKNPYADRNYLLMLNIWLVGILALAAFTASERQASDPRLPSDYVAFLLVLVALVVDSIALSAILFRLSAWGLTPNRAAVLGMNVIVFVNLLGIAREYLKFFKGTVHADSIKLSIAGYLPVYAFWAAFVTFGFPIVFQFK